MNLSVALGPCQDNTEELLRNINDPKIRIIKTTWNENIRNDLKVKGFVYGQQKSIAWFNCTGDWAFYLEGDEVVHEDDLPAIRESMERYQHDDEVEALIFDYIHFYGNRNTYAWSPAWYRRAPRVIKNTIPAWAPKGLFFTVLMDQKRARYPKAAHSNARIFHYGWCRSESEIQKNKDQIEKYWSNNKPEVKMREVDQQVLRLFDGTHPASIDKYLPEADGVYQANPDHVLTRREKKHRRMMKLENLLGVEFNKKHYTLVKK